jgi:hydroxymethylglutaryl-CoA lyase
MKKFVKICEVSARDGLQNERTILLPSVRAKYIDLITRAGFQSIEIGSFVSERWVPQMKDTQAVSHAIHKNMSTDYVALVPTLRQFSAFLQSKCDHTAVFTATSDVFSLKNTNRTVRQSMDEIRLIVDRANQECVPVRAYISTIIQCPYSGKQSKESVMNLCKELIGMGCYEVSLGDTNGRATPMETYDLLSYLTQEIPSSKLAVHFHDTYGYALENIYISLQHGIRTIDASIGGIGGCPYANGASGNVATERVLTLLDDLDIPHGIDVEKTKEARSYIFDALGKL